MINDIVGGANHTMIRMDNTPRFHLSYSYYLVHAVYSYIAMYASFVQCVDTIRRYSHYKASCLNELLASYKLATIVDDCVHSYILFFSYT